MAPVKRSLAETRWLLALKLVNTAFSGIGLCSVSSIERLRFGPYWVLYAVLFTFSVASLVLPWGSIVPCTIVGFLFSELFRPVNGHGSFEEAVAEVIGFGIFPVAGLVVGLIDEYLLRKRSRTAPKEGAQPVIVEGN